MPSASTINMLTGGAMHSYKALVDQADPAALNQFAQNLLDFQRRLMELNSQFHSAQQGMENQWVPDVRTGAEDGQGDQSAQPAWFDPIVADLLRRAGQMGPGGR